MLRPEEICKKKTRCHSALMEERRRLLAHYKAQGRALRLTGFGGDSLVLDREINVILDVPPGHEHLNIGRIKFHSSMTCI
jgi:hypothetical protein